MIFIAQRPYNFFQVNLTVQSPHKYLEIIGITNFEILSFTNKLLKKIVIHRILNINSGSAKTYFTLVQKRASNQSFDSLTQCSNVRKIVQLNSSFLRPFLTHTQKFAFAGYTWSFRIRMKKILSKQSEFLNHILQQNDQKSLDFCQNLTRPSIGFLMIL